MSLQSPENRERLNRLRAKLENTSQKPGVYLHKNLRNEVLYVGKAKNLRARLKSYFTSLDQHTAKTRALVEKIEDFEVIITENEYESLLLENNLIKHNMPPYNILLRDDKTYPYLKIDLSEEWPRLTMTRLRKKDKALYFGPYTIAGQMNQILNVINRFFPLIKCKPSFFKSVTRPCNYYDIKKCLGPCKLSVEKQEYQMHLNHVIDILNGHTDKIAKKIFQEMQLASKDLNYEKAAMLRDQYKSLMNLTENQTVALDNAFHLDMISFCYRPEISVFYVTSIRDGKLIGGHAVVVKDILQEPSSGEEEDLQEKMALSFICQYYSKKEIPESIFLSQAEKLISKENLVLTNQFLRGQKKNFQQENTSSHSQIFYTHKDIYLKQYKMTQDKKSFYDLEQFSLKNAENKFEEQIKIDESSSVFLHDLKSVLGLVTLPRYIECYDISTFQGSQTVASQVAFKDGQPFKSGYKKYIIKETVGKTDDFASLREVMRRRFKNTDLLPDALVIDGGAPQIREVGWVLKSLGLDHLVLVGLAKSRVQNTFQDSKVTSSLERLVLPARNEKNELLPGAPCNTLTLKEGSPSFRVLTHLRDEAHRFAITFHRKKRDQSSMKSVLLEVNGLGPKRRKQLLEICPDLKQILSENLNELSQKTKIPLNVLMDLREKLSLINGP